MARFLTFETTALKLNNSVFPCNSVSFALNANTTPVFDINGNLLYYSPTAPIQGKFQTQFYLTGALPNFLKLENQSETPTRISFNQFYIPSAYLTDLSFSVEPFQPVLVSTSYSFYHGLTTLNTDLNDTHTGFANTLKTLNGLSSYIVTTNRDTYSENPKDFIVTNFDYSFSVEREPVLRVKESVPGRVAMKQINAQFGITANNLDGRLKIQGNSAVFSGVLRDNTNLATSTDFVLTGIIVDQNYSMSESNYGISTVKMIQNINRKRNIITIPMEVEDYDISIPEFTIDDPDEKIFIPDDGRVNTGGPKTPELPPTDEKDLTAFFIITDIYVVSPGGGGYIDGDCDLKNRFQSVQTSLAQNVVFEPGSLIGYAVGYNQPPDANNGYGPPYYYIGRFKVSKQFLLDGGATKNDFINFVGNITLKEESTNDAFDRLITTTASFVVEMNQYVFNETTQKCEEYAPLHPMNWWGLEWSNIYPYIISNDQNILNQKSDYKKNPIIVYHKTQP